MLRWGRVEVTGGFLLMAAALYYMDIQNVLPWAAAACACHELGHILAIYGLGGRVARLRLSVAGAEMVLSAARPLNPVGDMLAALAGPVVNLALAVFSAGAGEHWYLFAGLNLSLAAFNLLPMEQLDGGRAICSLLTLLWSRHSAQRAVHLLSQLTAGVLLVAGAILLWLTKSNFTLIVTAFWLTLSLNGQKRRK